MNKDNSFVASFKNSQWSADNLQFTLKPSRHYSETHIV